MTRRITCLRSLAVVLSLGAALMGAPAFAEDTEMAAILALAAGADGHTVFKSSEAGLFRSGDAGMSWKPIDAPAGAKHVTALSTGAEASGALFAVADDIDVYASFDGGDSWSEASGDLPGEAVEAVAAHATEPQTVYAYLADAGIFRSKDAGITWKLMDQGPGEIQHLIHTNMEGSMETGWLYAATEDGIRFSMDCFCLWREGAGVFGPTAAVAVDPMELTLLFAAAGRDLFRSTNGGQDWEAFWTAPEAVTAITVSLEQSVILGTESGRLFARKKDSQQWEALSD